MSSLLHRPSTWISIALVGLIPACARGGSSSGGSDGGGGNRDSGGARSDAGATPDAARAAIDAASVTDAFSGPIDVGATEFLDAALPVDAAMAMVDTGPMDAGVRDTGPRDGGVGDSGPTDGAITDAGVPDVGTPDGGVVNPGGRYDLRLLRISAPTDNLGADWDPFGGSPDFEITVDLDGSMGTIRAPDNTNPATLNDLILMNVAATSTSVLRISVEDYDPFDANDPVGTCALTGLSNEALTGMDRAFICAMSASQAGFTINWRLEAR